MANLLTQLGSLAAAGMMLVSSAIDEAAPQHDADGTLFLINRQWRVSEHYVPHTVVANVQGDVRSMRPDAAAALEEMFDACYAETGKRMVTISGYRSYGTQNNIYNRKLRSTGSQAKADEYVARPGASEHQLGLAMDVNQRMRQDGLTSSFGRTETGKWLAENCWRFGFILRYQEGWEDILRFPRVSVAASDARDLNLLCFRNDFVTHQEVETNKEIARQFAADCIEEMERQSICGCFGVPVMCPLRGSSGIR